MKDMALAAQRTKLIVDLHLGIEASLRRSVQDAIKIGELLTQQKDDLGHGNFLPWVEKELPFSERTARRYMSLFEYRSKTATVADLTQAYQVAQIEDQRQHPKARPAAPETVERQRKRNEDRPKRRPEEPKAAPHPQSKSESGQARKEGADSQERSRRGRAIVDAGGPDAVTTVLLEEIDTLLAALPDDLARHHVVNTLIKALREKSIQLNRKAGAA